MQFKFNSKTGVAIVAVLTALACQYAMGQDAPKIEASKGLPPRATPGDYQSHGKAGSVTIGAEFTDHSIATPDATYTTEDYVIVEVGLFGPAGSHLALNYQDFSLRINGKKAGLPAQPYALVFKSLKDPLYVAPELANQPKESKNGFGNGGNDQNQSNLPPVIHIPIGIERAMQQKVQRASLPEGDRPLPEAGLLFFEHRGKTASAELIYSGPAGKATIALQP